MLDKGGDWIQVCLRMKRSIHSAAVVLHLFLSLADGTAGEALDPFVHVSGAGRLEDAQAVPLTFSGTQRWARVFLDQTKDEPRLLPKDWSSRVVLPSPPANGSPRTAKEVEYLLDLQAKRMPADEAAIRKEAEFAGMRFGKHGSMDLLDVAKRPWTAALMDAGAKQLNPLLFKLKLRFDRVRPSILDPRLKPVMKVPGHPAYPSGHASQAFFIAYLLAELDPPNREVYLADAIGIAKRREIAGFHYPSDTAAGALLARQVLDLLLVQKQFHGLLEKALEEWKPKLPSI